ncbi:Six-hairpin glycosidase-like protein [Kockovaella imperatae]|uniref:glucan 1,4-alpha-glucosidase n=1 Tax=Kockovaella imperatae TaxID=4999 RepID=A0A1Y1UL67_9TREE|nr:Six-hairpin glycosidase-like protein [Kockovaella imperatae]ORX37845.1 Six-hairpin glycosidase-like protein [Kockovaella imperatae]
MASAAPGSPFDKWIESEKDLALTKILENIGPAAGASDGLVVASPSKENPDYFYTWTRDSALTMSSLLPLMLPSSFLPPSTYHPMAIRNTPRASQGYSQSPNNKSRNSSIPNLLFEPFLRAYIMSQQEIQMVNTPSGNLITGGLSEPKYRVDGTAFEGPWGRPQRDGSALRALSMIPYANFLHSRGNDLDRQWLIHHLFYPQTGIQMGNTIKNDLEEVANAWWRSGFDLWEEVDGHHLFTRLVSLRALQLGSKLAGDLGDQGAKNWYAGMADRIKERLKDFWMDDDEIAHSTGYWSATIFHPSINFSSPEHIDYNRSSRGLVAPPSNYDRSGLDCAFPLCVIHTGTVYPYSSLDDISFEPTLPSVLGTLHRYILTFDGLYKINEGKKWTEGWAVGRYKEDIYDGIGTSLAHPWFICTFSVAHVFYLAYTSFSRQGEITLTNQTIPFWSDLLSHTSDTALLQENERWSSSSLASAVSKHSFETAMGALLDVAEGYMGVGKKYAEKGRMSEQINRENGAAEGARDLTWSYAAFIEASRARQEAQAIAKAGKAVQCECVYEE